MDWLNDERTDAANAASFIGDLFERAIADVVVTAELWTAYASFVLNSSATARQGAGGAAAGDAHGDGKAAVRAVFERAVSAVGAVPDVGPKVWAAYREFETDELEDLEDSDDDDSDDDDDDDDSSDDDKDDDSKEAAVKAQTARLTALFDRQLAIPLPGNDAIMSMYTSLCTAQVTRTHARTRTRTDGMREHPVCGLPLMETSLCS